MQFRICVLVLGALLAGCATGPTGPVYVPRGEDLSKMATVATESDPIQAAELSIRNPNAAQLAFPVTMKDEGHYVYFLQIDGKSSYFKNVPKHYFNEVWLPPGYHVIVVAYRHNRQITAKRFTLYAQAGDKYFVHREATPYGANLWMTNNESAPQEAAQPLGHGG